MKTVLILSMLTMLYTLSLSAMDIDIKREFTVTQIMIELQKTYMDETRLEEEDLNISDQQEYSFENM
jgi:hypothetical protein